MDDTSQPAALSVCVASQQAGQRACLFPLALAAGVAGFKSLREEVPPEVCPPEVCRSVAFEEVHFSWIPDQPISCEVNPTRKSECVCTGRFRARSAQTTHPLSKGTQYWDITSFAEGVMVAPAITANASLKLGKERTTNDQQVVEVPVRARRLRLMTMPS